MITKDILGKTKVEKSVLTESFNYTQDKYLVFLFLIFIIESNYQLLNKENIMKNTGNSSQSKQKGIPKNLIIIGAVVLVLIVIGYAVQNFLLRKAGERVAESLIKAKTGVDVDINSGKESIKIAGKEGEMEIGNTASWPSDIPVPKFPTGTVTVATTSNNNWAVILKDVKKEDVEKYISDLQKNGWQASSEVSFMVDLTQMEKGAYRVSVAYDASSNGVSITVSQKEQ